MIEKATKNNWIELIDVWEASVRATHHFLHPEDIDYYRYRVFHEYFDLMDLYQIKDESGRIAGFSGLSEDNLEMLFIRPEMRGRGIGKRLVEHALSLGILKVDVNEENEQALGFYRKMGYEAVVRSAVDSDNKNYPIIHMEYKP